MNAKPVICWGKLFHGALGFVGVAVPIFIVSHYLQFLSGAALWLPPAWRNALGVFVTFLGLLMFNFIRLRQPKRERKSGAMHRGIRNSFVCGFAALILVMIYYGLGQACNYWWPQASEWFDANQSMPTPSESIRQHANPQKIPLFVDIEQSSIFVPVGPFRPPDLRKYCELIRSDPANANGGDPVRYMLDREPAHLIDILDGDGKLYVYAQMIPFAVLHLAIILLLAAAIGFQFQTREAVGEWLANFTRGQG